MSTAAGFIETAWTMVRLRRYAAADELFVRALTVEPGNVSALGGRAVAIDGQGHHAAAIDMAGAAISAAPTASWPRYILGWLHSSHHRWAEASRQYSEAIRLDPHNVEAWSERANCAYCLGRYGPAQDDAREALRLQPDKAEALITLGMSLFNTGRQKEGLRTLEHARARHPDNAFVHANIGYCLSAQGWHDEAAKSFERALQIRPDEQQWVIPLLRSLRDRLPLCSLWANVAGQGKFVVLVWLSWLSLLIAKSMDLYIAPTQWEILTMAVVAIILQTTTFIGFSPMVAMLAALPTKAFRRLLPPGTRAAVYTLGAALAAHTLLLVDGLIRMNAGTAWLTVLAAIVAFAAYATQRPPRSRKFIEFVLLALLLAWAAIGVLNGPTRLWTAAGLLALATLMPRLARMRARTIEPGMPRLLG